MDKASVIIPEKIEAKAIGGWLILLGIGIVVSPFRIFSHLTVYPPFFRDGTWEALTTPASENYSPLWAPYIMGEILFNFITGIIFVFLIYLFFTKKKKFRNYYLAIAVFSFFFILFDAWFLTLILPDAPMFNPEMASEMVQSLIGCLIWGPYLFLSERSKETFIR
jgi:hypothetical protein